jgi:hypothetical protein
MVYSKLEKCAQDCPEAGGWVDQLGDRFFTDHEDFGRTRGALSQTAINIFPQVFDPDAERNTSFVTEALQRWAPRFFVDDDDDDDDDD